MTSFQRHATRWGFCFLGVLFWFGVVMVRLVDLQIMDADQLKDRSERLHKSVMNIPSKRGTIYDRNGKILAISQVQPTVCADPSVIESPAETAKAIGDILQKDRKWRKKIAKRLSDKERSFTYIERFISPRQWNQIEELNIKGVFCQKEPKRHYPKDYIASHVLGFVSPLSGSAEGTEHTFSQYIAGTPGQMQTLRDGRRKRIWLGPQMIKEPVMGSDITLTIDENIQFFVENAIRRGLADTRASNITAIVMDPQTGAVLAMANAPDFNPNFFWQFNAFKRKNRAVVDVYEPASAFKIITVAAAIDSGKIGWNDSFFCEEGGITVFGKYIKDNKKFGNLNVKEILWHSSNVGSIKIAFKMEPALFHEYIERFGFGQKTGIDLPAEADGQFHPLGNWTKVSPAYLSIGHEISATSLQMLRAASVVANGGYLVEPYIGERVSKDISLKPEAKPIRVIKESTANQMKAALEGVVTRGTAKTAAIPGVDVFGKTGTAQRLVNRTYSTQKYNASFVGFFPVQKPRYGIIVVVHDPKNGKVHGGEVAAPIFSEIGKQIVLYENNIPGLQQRSVRVRPGQTPSWATQPLEPHRQGVMPDLTGLGLRNALSQCALLGIDLDVQGEGVVVEQSPQPGSGLTTQTKCKIKLGAG